MWKSQLSAQSEARRTLDLAVKKREMGAQVASKFAQLARTIPGHRILVSHKSDEVKLPVSHFGPHSTLLPVPPSPRTNSPRASPPHVYLAFQPVPSSRKKSPDFSSVASSSSPLLSSAPPLGPGFVRQLHSTDKVAYIGNLRRLLLPTKKTSKIRPNRMVQLGMEQPPEDPPPPPGGVEEDDEDGEGDLNIGDGAVSWFTLFLLGNVLFGLTKHIWGTGGSRGSAVLCDLPTAEGSATIPGLLGQRPLPQPLSAEQIKVARALDPEVPTLVRHVADIASFHSVAPTPSKVHRIFVSRRAYILFGVLPGLGFLLAVLRLLLPLSANRNLVQINPVPPPAAVEHEQDEANGNVEDPGPLPSPPTTPHRFRVPPAPHPSPVSPRRQRPRAPLPFRDAATQVTCNGMLELVRARTAERTVREEEKQDGDKYGVGERKERVRVVQRRMWRLLYELRRGDAAEAAEDEEAAVADDDEDM
ncbi:hypothetical protein C8F04DRAFT_1227282 [Mycena alexandri]|uniref:Uncharacterized protein n=1 Tax=Mycena alexandri TaxID=1745969 RepID=A0AAD6TJH2_9AGAR|nr:hypothetical protein C8F04DRAFT_1227282 [Mycena alexandri]